LQRLIYAFQSFSKAKVSSCDGKYSRASMEDPMDSFDTPITRISHGILFDVQLWDAKV